MHLVEPPIPPVLVRRTYRIGLFGEFSSGKSSLINALLKAGQATSVVPTTQDIAVLHGGSIDVYDDLLRMVHADAPLTSRGATFWDTPGPNSENPRHEDLALEAGGQVDHLLLLVSANDGLTKTVVQLYEKLGEGADRSAPIWLLFTKRDRLEFDDEEEQDEILTELRGEVRERMPNVDRVFFLDCRDLRAFDGPQLQEGLQHGTEAHVRLQLDHEFQEDRQHWLRQRVALGRRGVDDLPVWAVSAELARGVELWAEHCAEMRDRRRIALRAVYVGLPKALMVALIDAWASAIANPFRTLLGRRRYAAFAKRRWRRREVLEAWREDLLAWVPEPE